MTVYHRFNRPIPGPGALNFARSLDLTRQEFKDECDINYVMARFQQTGMMPQSWSSPPVASYGDFAEAPDFLEAQNIILRSKEQFASLPSAVRNRFNNDPAELLRFIHSPNNYEEAKRLGLLRAEAEPPPAPPPGTPPKEGG